MRHPLSAQKAVSARRGKRGAKVHYAILSGGKFVIRTTLASIRDGKSRILQGFRAAAGMAGGMQRKARGTSIPTLP